MINKIRRTITIAKIEAELLEIISENHQKMESVHEEQRYHVMIPYKRNCSIKKVKEREFPGNSIADSFRKLENVSQSKWKVTLNAWEKNKNQEMSANGRKKL